MSELDKILLDSDKAELLEDLNKKLSTFNMENDY